MMRELFRSRMGLAVLAGLGLSVAASSANAALFTIDLRVAGTGAKSATVTNPGDVVTLEVYARVANADGDRSNDGFQTANIGLVSADAGALGNLSSSTLNTAVLDAGVSQGGTPLNRDGNPDLEVGGADVNVAAGWVIYNSGTATKFATGSGAGETEFLLGTTTWTFTGGAPGSFAAVNADLRIRTTGLAASKVMERYTTDGVVHQEDPGVAPGNANV